MRLIRITTNYPRYLKNFYNKYPDLSNQKYEEQYKTLMSDCFGWADFWTHALNKQGYEVWEPVANAEVMQKIWAKENNCHYQELNWLTDIIKAQVCKFKPEVLFVDDYNTFSREFLIDLKDSCQSIKLVLGWCGAPYDNIDVFNAYDIVLSNIPELVIDFQSSGHQSKYFKHAFDPRILSKINSCEDENSSFLCSFIGSIVAGNLGHNKRALLIQELIKVIDISVFCDVYKPNNKDFFVTGVKGIIYDLIQALSSTKLFRDILQKIPKIRNYTIKNKRPKIPPQLHPSIYNRAKPPVFGIDMFQTLYSSQVTLNNHIDLSRSSASNMRLFEATGVGTCLVTDWKQNIGELFEPDIEVVTYRSPEECLDKIKWLLNNPIARKKIAKAGQARTLRDHTFGQRAIVLDKIIQEFISKR